MLSVPFPQILKLNDNVLIVIYSQPPIIFLISFAFVNKKPNGSK